MMTSSHATGKSQKPLKIGLVGSGYIASIHYESLKQLEGCEIAAQADPDQAKHQQFLAAGRTVPRYYLSHKQMLKEEDLDVICIGIPNFLHASVVCDALKAGVHVIIEKPLCLNLKEAEEIIDLSKRKGLLVGYAEELCYVPKYERVKRIVDEQGLGKLYMVRQTEKHNGPHSLWFFQRKTAGGGALMDMGCHSIEFCRWMFNKQPIKWVWGYCANYLHTNSEVEDHVIATLGFEDGSIGCIEASWALQGGEDSRAAVFGTEGVAYVDMLKETGIKVYSQKGFPAMPHHPGDVSAPQTIGWSTPTSNWLWTNGYPQEIQEFLNCIRFGGTPRETVEDGKIVLEIMAAIYLSAKTGNRVSLPLSQHRDFVYPIDLWKG